MTEYEVWYRKKSTFMEDKKLKASDISKRKTHVLVALEVGSKDDVFRNMQGEFMSPKTAGLVISRIKSGETDHQSMSVGDVLRDAETGVVYQCAMVGWTKVK